MPHKNTIAIISSNEYSILELKNMLVLLREIDNVVSVDYYDAEDFIKENNPSVIVLHAANDDKNAIKTLKKIKEYKETKNTPVILFSDYCSSDFIIEGFDCGIDDIIQSPVKDWEFVIRVIWAIQKNEIKRAISLKDAFLQDLGILDVQTGFYKGDFSLKYLERTINFAKKEKQSAFLLLVKIVPIAETEKYTKTVVDSIKSSIRKNDIIAAKDSSSFYIFLSRTNLNGVYAFWERFLDKSNPIMSINACAVEIQEEIFDDIINVLEFSINKPLQDDDIYIVQKQDFVDLYKNNDKEELGIAKILKEEKNLTNDVTEAKINVINKENKKNDDEEEKINLGLKIMQEKIKEADFTELAKMPDKPPVKPAEDDKSVDERNASLYKQTYKKKLKMVVTPLFKKVAGAMQSAYALLDANINVSPQITFLKLEKDDVRLNFEMVYNGLRQILFKISLFALGTEIETEKFELEVMELDYTKLEAVLNTAIDEYKNYLTNG